MNHFQINQLLEIKYKGTHLAEYVGDGTRIHNNINDDCYIFNIFTSRGTLEYSVPKESISEKLKNKDIQDPSKRTINKFKKQLKQLQNGVISVGSILEKLGKINQNIHN